MVQEFVEENTGEDGLLEDAVNDDGKATQSGVRARLREIGGDPEFAEEQKALEHCLALLETETLAKQAIRTLQEKLDEQVLAKYPALTDAEIRTLIVEDKWFTSVRAAVENEVHRLAQQLASRVKELEERYAQPLPELEREVEAFRIKVEDNLKKMGVVWA
jgi:type I restriction enzyme M protein